jgi:hypothetical protein
MDEEDYLEMRQDTLEQARISWSQVSVVDPDLQGY